VSMRVISQLMWLPCCAAERSSAVVAGERCGDPLVEHSSKREQHASAPPCVAFTPASNTLFIPSLHAKYVVFGMFRSSPISVPCVNVSVSRTTASETSSTAQRSSTMCNSQADNRHYTLHHTSYFESVLDNRS
jgi:hypothetical protein